MFYKFHNFTSPRGKKTMFMRRVFLESEWSEKHDLDRDAILKIPKCFFLHHCEKNN